MGKVPPVGKIDKFLKFHWLQMLFHALCLCQKPVCDVKNRNVWGAFGCHGLLLSLSIIARKQDISKYRPFEQEIFCKKQDDFTWKKRPSAALCGGSVEDFDGNTF